jgi:ABC-type phosphate transport system permease subunit
MAAAAIFAPPEPVREPTVHPSAVIGEGVKEAVREQGALGILAGSFTAASVGTTAALILGLVAAIFGKSRPKQL